MPAQTASRRNFGLASLAGMMQPLKYGRVTFPDRNAPAQLHIDT